MPTYTNTLTTEAFSCRPSCHWKAGETKEVEFYVQDLPPGVEFVSHEPIVSPWTLIAAVTSAPMAEPIDISGQDNISIYNDTNAPIQVSMNTDDENAIWIASQQKLICQNLPDGYFGCVRVLSMGTGTVYIHGVLTVFTLLELHA